MDRWFWREHALIGKVSRTEQTTVLINEVGTLKTLHVFDVREAPFKV